MQLWVKEDQIIPKHTEKIEEMKQLQHTRLKYHSDNTNTILILMQNSKHIVASTTPRNMYFQITQACSSCFYCMYTSYTLAYFTDKEIQRMCFYSLDQIEK